MTKGIEQRGEYKLGGRTKECGGRREGGGKAGPREPEVKDNTEEGTKGSGEEFEEVVG